MPVATYLKDKQKKIESKYHRVAKQFESKYELIHRKVTSRFHIEAPEIELVRSRLNDLFKKSTASVDCLLYTSPSPRDATLSRMPSSA